MTKAGKIFSVHVKNKNVEGDVFFQFKGCDKEYANAIIRMFSTRSLTPEPLRVAHLIGSGIVFGESRGQA